jgi:hypothetical protein
MDLAQDSAVVRLGVCDDEPYVSLTEARQLLMLG